jgi:hypothetical protein
MHQVADMIDQCGSLTQAGFVELFQPAGYDLSDVRRYQTILNSGLMLVSL